jgi:hypothetical protein
VNHDLYSSAAESKPNLVITEAMGALSNSRLVTEAMGTLSSSRLVIEAKGTGNKVVGDSTRLIYSQGGGRWGCAGQLGKGEVGGG